MMLIGLAVMAAALAVLLFMTVSLLRPGLMLSLMSYGLIFAGAFCFVGGVLRRRR